MAAPIPIEQAFAHILAQSGLAAIERVGLREALGHYLAEDIRADRDWPPFNRSSVDGFAVFSPDTRSAPDVLEVIEEVAAGTAPTRALAPGQAIKIMTGAPVPAGADCVIMQEQTAIPKPGFVRFMNTMRSGQNIARRGEDAKTGEIVIQSGTYIGPAEVGVLAAVGCHAVPVRRKPGIAILGSGDEVVEPDAIPGAAQIRNSNSYQLLAQCAAHQLDARYLGIARDDREATRKLIEEGLSNAGVLISTGGVSVGDHDHVGAVLNEQGVEIFFNRVAIKPGKPTTFGRRGETLVFGLPGNPVAALVCFHLLAMTAIRVRMGARDPLPRWIPLPVDGCVKGAADRTTFLPCKLAVKDGRTMVRILEWHGSGHIAALVNADGLFVQKPNETIEDGQTVTYYPF